MRRAAAMLLLAAMGAAPPHTNRLVHESSPYLLQHAHNPVDWYPWGEEAFAAARREDKPIFLSIGYSTCHWCHVMERESFENGAIAAEINRGFIPVKVDREERPDVDNVYMTACQLMTRSGGWPLTVILTPAGDPWFSGTYFPPRTRGGMVGLAELLPRLSRAWTSERREVEEQAAHVREAVRAALTTPPAASGSAPPLDARQAELLRGALRARFDAPRGSFGGPPNFPQHGALAFLLAGAAGSPEAAPDRAMLESSLDAMERGGIFDAVGGGFHRYTVDGQWALPHFEKMLYDNAQLLEVYAGAARAFGRADYRETAQRTIAWLEREMKLPGGAYAAALDADSEGVEGKYYLWTSEEIDRALGPHEAPLYRAAYAIEPSGNLPAFFEEGHGRNLPRRGPTAAELARSFGLTRAQVEARLRSDNALLEEIRSRRVPPFRDDKAITSWNALAASGLARASRDLAEKRDLEIATRILRFLLSTNVKDGRLLHATRDGKGRVEGFLDDYADLCRALLDAADAGGPADFRGEARALARTMVARFHDARAGGFFDTPFSGPRGLLDCAKEFLDSTTPAGNAVAVEVLERLDRLAPDPELARAAADTRRAAAPYARAFPAAAGSWAIASLALIAPSEAPPAPSEAAAGPVRVEIRIREERLRSGGEAAGTLRIVLGKGWHVQSHAPAPGYVPADVAFAPPAGVEVTSVDFPAGEPLEVAGDRLSVYSREALIPFRLRAEPTAPAGTARLGATVTFQACDNRRCLAAQSVEISAPLTIGP